MARPRHGSAFVKHGKVVVQVRLRADAPRRFWTAECPARSDGVPVDIIYARSMAANLQRAYDAGTWDPLAAAEPEAPRAEPTVREFADVWGKSHSYETAARERVILLRLFAEAPIGAMRVADVRPRHVLEFLGWLRQLPALRGKRAAPGGRLSPRTVRSYFDMVKRMFDDAVAREILPANPCAAARGKLPAIEDADPEARAGWFFDRAEVWTILTDPRIPWVRRARYAIEFLTGARPGEVAALRWGDWDRTTEPLTRLTIRRAMKILSKKVGTTKTKAVKVVPVHPALDRILAAWWETGWRETFGRDPKPDDLVVPTRNGKMQATAKAGARFEGDVTRLGLRVRHHYCTRHTFISQAQEDGADPTFLRWVTHAPPRSAFDGYTRVQWVRLCVEVAKLGVGPGKRTTPRLTPEESLVIAQAAGNSMSERSGEFVYQLDPASRSDADGRVFAGDPQVAASADMQTATPGDGLTPGLTPPGVAAARYAAEAGLYDLRERELAREGTDDGQ